MYFNISVICSSVIHECPTSSTTVPLFIHFKPTRHYWQNMALIEIQRVGCELYGSFWSS